MKVTSITQRNRKRDNKEYWEVRLDGDDKPLLMFTKPEFQENFDISTESLQIAKSGTYYNLVTKKTGRSQTRAFFPRNDDDIMLQVALKAVVELEQHHFPPEGKLNIPRVAQATNELFGSLIMMRPKKDKDA